jgi:hypothetical protein
LVSKYATEAHLGNTLDHVLDVSAGSADGSELLGLSPPHLNLQTLSADLDHIDLEVTEVLVESTTGTSDGHLTSLNVKLDYT